MTYSRNTVMPIVGILFVVVAIIGGFVAGTVPDVAGSTAEEIARYHADNKDRVMAGVITLSIATVLLIFFASHLRSVLDRGAGEDGTFSLIAFAGAVVFGVGGAIDGTLLIAMSEAADDLDPAQLETLQAFWDNDFLPLAFGIVLFTLASGISIVLHKSLPVWLGWIAIMLGLVGMSPIGWIAFMGAGVWILVVSVMLLLNERKGASASPGVTTSEV